MKNIIILFVFICMLGGCNNENDIADIFIQGESGSIYLENLDEKDKVDVQLTFSIADSDIYEEYIVLKCEKDIIQKFNIPRNTYACHIHTYKNGQYIENYTGIVNGVNQEKINGFYPVYVINGEDTVISKGTASYAMFHQQSFDEVMRIFYMDSVLYPKDLSRYFLKWIKLPMTQKPNMKDILAKDMVTIEENMQGFENYDFICAIGHKLLGDTVAYRISLRNMSLKPTPALNHGMLSNRFWDLFGNELKSGKDNNLIFRDIILANPNSKFTLNKLIPDNISYKDQEWIIGVLDTLMKTNKAYYYKILFSKFDYYFANIHKSEDQYLNKIEKIEDKFDYAFKKGSTALFEEGRNPYTHTLPLKYNCDLGFARYFTTIKKYDRALRKCDAVLEDSTYEEKMIYVGAYIQKGHTFEHKGDIDSALKNYIFAYSINKNGSWANNTIKKYRKKYNIISPYEHWLDSLCSTYKFEIRTCNIKGQVDLQVELLNGRKLNTDKLKKPLILFFTSVNCKACRYIINDLNQNVETKNIIENEYDLTIISFDSKDDINSLLIPFYHGMYCISDYNTLMGKFNITGHPEIIIINTDGKIEDRISGAHENWKLRENL